MREHVLEAVKPVGNRIDVLSRRDSATWPTLALSHVLLSPLTRGTAR